jgi:LPXTG-motif cell wall-anchored protein
MQKIIGIGLMVAGLTSAAFAFNGVPEIDGSTAVSALTLLSGAMLVIRRRKK